MLLRPFKAVSVFFRSISFTLTVASFAAGHSWYTWGDWLPPCLFLEVKGSRPSSLVHSLPLALPALSISFSPSWKALDGPAEPCALHSLWLALSTRGAQVMGLTPYESGRAIPSGKQAARQMPTTGKYQHYPYLAMRKLRPWLVEFGTRLWK